MGFASSCGNGEAGGVDRITGAREGKMEDDGTTAGLWCGTKRKAQVPEDSPPTYTAQYGPRLGHTLLQSMGLAHLSLTYLCWAFSSPWSW